VPFLKSTSARTRGTALETPLYVVFITQPSPHFSSLSLARLQRVNIRLFVLLMPLTKKEQKLHAHMTSVPPTLRLKGRFRGNKS
jgi:hypothetical protein